VIQKKQNQNHLNNHQRLQKKVLNPSKKLKKRRSLKKRLHIQKNKSKLIPAKTKPKLKNDKISVQDQNP
jgi:hypothetical protein